MDILLLTVLIIICIILLVSAIIIIMRLKNISSDDSIDKIKKDIVEELRISRQESVNATQQSISTVSDVLNKSISQSIDMQDKRLNTLNEQLKSNALQNEQKLENIRISVESNLKHIQQDNAKQLEQMRQTVDEKLQKTLNDRITQSFNLVSERLEQVYKGLGEMQNLAAGVGDLKKVLSNVKTRGILGEIQLGAILEQILSPEQYKTNVATKPGSRDVVEFAVCLPGDDDGVVYLPIDSKFPADMYTNLMDAYNSGDAQMVTAAGAMLEKSIKQSAKTIHDKYIAPPSTTDFGIMFLPVEGLYAEVIRRGLVEVLQRDYKINIAGPTTMAAMLNSLQMGFKTLAIQKHSGEVWNVLGAVKTEFDKFESVLAATQNRLEQANRELDKLVGVRTRKIQSALKNVAAVSQAESTGILTDNMSDDDIQ